MYENVKVDNIVIDITTACNLNCMHCYNRKVDDSRHMNYESLVKIIEELSKYGVTEITISGGEPLLHTEIEKIVHIPMSYPNINFVVATNGMLLTDDLIAQMEKVDNLIVQISIDGSDMKTYEKQRGVGSFNDFYRGFLLLAQSSVKRKASIIVVTKVNCRDVENMYVLSVEHDILPTFKFADYMGNAKNNWKSLTLNLAQKMHVINIIKKMNIQYDKKVHVPIPGSACEFSVYAERTNFLIQVDGTVVACQWLLDYPLGNILGENLPDILKSDVMMHLYEIGSKRREALNVSSSCMDCSVRNHCYLGCLGVALINGNEIGLDDDCAFRKAEVALRFFDH